MNFIKLIFYKFINKISEIPLIERSGSTGLISREILNHLKKLQILTHILEGYYQKFPQTSN